MPLISYGDTLCNLCHRAFEEQDRVYYTGRASVPQTHPLADFNDLLMHLSCALEWPHHVLFARQAARKDKRRTLLNDCWDKVFENPDCLVTTNPDLGESSVTILDVGTDLRISDDNWSKFLDGQYKPQSLFPQELSLLDSILPALRDTIPTVEILHRAIDWDFKQRKIRRAERKRARRTEQDERKILSHNLKYEPLLRLVATDGLRCPRCQSEHRHFKTFAGTPQKRAYIVCRSCGGSVYP